MEQQQTNPIVKWLDISRAEFREILRPERNAESRVKGILYLVGFIFGAIAVAGALFGFKRAYRRFGEADAFPVLSPLPKVFRAAMIIWGAAFLVLTYLGIQLVAHILKAINPNAFELAFLIAYIISSLLFSFLFMVRFERWRTEVSNGLVEAGRFGSARTATLPEMMDLAQSNKGYYIGGDFLFYSKLGHSLVCSSARGGKGTNVLVPNLLGKSSYEGSWFVIDVKGELTAICAEYQRSIGQDVQVLDPWELTGEPQATYNPLDIFDNTNEEHLSENADLIAEMIVPINPESRDSFWDDKARSIISGLIMHLVLTQSGASRSLMKVWEWLRYEETKWAELLADMSVSDNPIVSGVANDVLTTKINSDRMYGSIMSIMESHTSFLKSPALRRSLSTSSFNINDLTKGKTTLFCVLPADKISTQSKWLRLVTTTALTAAVRHHDKRVTFMMDEFASLGFLPVMETGMGLYAGYNITLMPVVQNLSQLKKLYKDNWETFLANAAVRTFFSVNEKFTMDYLSSIIGERTVLTYETTATGSRAHATQRKLFTPDEIRRGSASNVFLFVEQRPVIVLPKLPYYEMPGIKDRAGDNPYMTALNDTAPQRHETISERIKNYQ